MDQYSCYFDGCCEPMNPYGNMGMGAYIKEGDTVIWKYSDFIPRGKGNSNNVAEYSALERILVQFQSEGIKDARLSIYGDSKLVIMQMRGDWRIKEGIYVPFALRVKKLIEKLREENRLHFEFSWIPREKNVYTDELSKGELIRRGVEFRIQPLEKSHA